MDQATRKVLRCYAENRGGKWEAFCIDFDLAVQGDTFEVVYRDLHRAIVEYLSYVRSLPSEEREAFLNRVAPLGTRLRFMWHVLRQIVSPGDGGRPHDGGRMDFLLPACA